MDIRPARRRRTAVVPLLVAACVMTGCGNGDPDSETVATPTASPASNEPAVDVTTPAPVIGGRDDLNALWDSWTKRERREYCKDDYETTASWWVSDDAEAEYGFRILVVDALAFTEGVCPDRDQDDDGYEDDVDAYPDNPNFNTPQTVVVHCDAGRHFKSNFTIDRITRDFSQAWATQFPVQPFTSCNIYGPNLQPLTKVEQADYEATPNRYIEYAIKTAYEQCTEHGTDWTMNKWPVSRAQVEEARTALTYCPDHPDREAIESHIAQIDIDAQLESEGRLFYDGLYRVGARIQPGTYFVTHVNDCYWERLDRSGNIIDNYFGTALRVEVYVASTDYSFRAEGCGEWRPVE